MILVDFGCDWSVHGRTSSRGKALAAAVMARARAWQPSAILDALDSETGTE